MGGLFSFYLACCCSVQILILEANPIKSGTVDCALLSDTLSFWLGREPHQSRLEKTAFDIFDNPTNIHHRQVELKFISGFLLLVLFLHPKSHQCNPLAAVKKSNSFALKFAHTNIPYPKKWKKTINE